MPTETNKTASTKKEQAQAEQPQAKAPTGTQVRWDTKNLKSSYANVCSVTSTREEVVLNFGINQAWERAAAQMEVELTNRIILSPFAASRLLEMLNKLMAEYESRYGELKQQIPASSTDTKQ